MTSVLERLARIAREDVQRALFGAQTHDHRPLPPASAHEVAAIEARLGVALPSELHAHLLDVSSGGMGPGYGLLWLPTLLTDANLPDGEWYATLARRAFADDASRQWARERFAPLTDAEIDRRLDELALPSAIRATLRADAGWTRTFEGRRDAYLASIVDPVRELARGPRRAALPFPFATRHDAVPSTATDGTVPLCDYGCGMGAHLVVTGALRGTVWTLDRENMILHPGAPGSLAATGEVPPPRFADWFSGWIADAERELAAGVTRRGRQLWA